MLLTAERVVVNGRAQAGVGITVSREGRITGVRPLADGDRPARVLADRLLVPGFVDTQAQVWPRLATLVVGDAATLPDALVRVAERLHPEDLLAAARFAFGELLLDGITTVSVLHTLHRQPNGAPYDDPLALADAVVQAAREVGLRLCLVRGVRVPERGAPAASVASRRGADASVETAAEELVRMAQRLLGRGDARLAWGLGTESVAAVSRSGLIALKTRFAHAPFHLALYGELATAGVHGREGALETFATANLVDSCTVLASARELSTRERDWVSLFGASVCALSSQPSVVGRLLRDLPICLGSGPVGSVRATAGAVGAMRGGSEHAGAARSNGEALFAALTRHGAAATQVDAGTIEVGRWADLASYDLNDPVFADADDAELVARLVRGGAELRPREVAVQGRWLVEEGQLASQADARRAAEISAARLLAN